LSSKVSRSVTAAAVSAERDAGVALSGTDVQIARAWTTFNRAKHRSEAAIREVARRATIRYIAAKLRCRIELDSGRLG
jgi:hypothetical protein